MLQILASFILKQIDEKFFGHCLVSVECSVFYTREEKRMLRWKKKKKESREAKNQSESARWNLPFNRAHLFARIPTPRSRLTFRSNNRFLSSAYWIILWIFQSSSNAHLSDKKNSFGTRSAINSKIIQSCGVMRVSQGKLIEQISYRKVTN